MSHDLTELLGGSVDGLLNSADKKHTPTEHQFRIYSVTSLPDRAHS